MDAASELSENEDKITTDGGCGSSASANNGKKMKRISFAEADGSCQDVRSDSATKYKGDRDPAAETSPPPTTSASTKPEWLEDLDEMQVSMFKQVFEMLDTDGGGSIDATELFNVMKDLDMQISLEEIKNTLRDLDKDGNGEIDFDEFLFCMSETDRYLDMLQGGSTDDDGPQPYNKRQTLFFTAITRFAMKNSLGEIERYYANKVRHAPHVISCYTAGARLIGLNDRQLEDEIRRMQKAAKNVNSPYAKPLPFVTLTKRKRKPKPPPPKPKEEKTPKPGPAGPDEKQTPKPGPAGPDEKKTRGPMSKPGPAGSDQKKTLGPMSKPGPAGSDQKKTLGPMSGGSDDSIDSDFVPPLALRQRRQTFVAPDDDMLKILRELVERGSVVAKIPDIHLVPGIRQKLAHGGEPLCSSMRKKRKQQEQHNGTDKKRLGKKKNVVAHGWVIPRIERGQAPLPVIRFARSGKHFTIEDVPEIRKKVSFAMDGYYTELKKAHVKTAYEHWSSLHTDLIRSKKVADAFQRVYRAYSPHKIQEVFALCPWTPGPRYTYRQPRVVVERSQPPPIPGRARTATYKSSRFSPHPPVGPRSSSSLSSRPLSRTSDRTA